MTKHLAHILYEMCNRVGADPTTVNFQAEGYYKQYSWTNAQQEAFIDWMADYLYTTTEARRELLTITSRSKKRCLQAAREFTFNYGWTLKETTDAQS